MLVQLNICFSIFQSRFLFIYLLFFFSNAVRLRLEPIAVNRIECRRHHRRRRRCPLLLLFPHSRRRRVICVLFFYCAFDFSLSFFLSRAPPFYLLNFNTKPLNSFVGRWRIEPHRRIDFNYICGRRCNTKERREREKKNCGWSHSIIYHYHWQRCRHRARREFSNSTQNGIFN